MNAIPNNPDEIRSQLAELAAVTYDGLMMGSYRAREYFENFGQPLNRPLAANLTRYHALEYIHTNRRLNAPYLIQNASNNGIAFSQDRYLVKVLKGRDGNPPIASRTRRSQRFYEQSLPGQLFLPGIDWSNLWNRVQFSDFVRNTAFINLILCWEADASYSVNHLALMCPRETGTYGQGVRLFWQRPVPHPVLDIVASMHTESETVDDLNVYFEDETEQGDDD